MMVERWTGVEVLALRKAKRMSLHAFSAHLGVSERTLSTWESRGRDIAIRDANQAALDGSLKASSVDVRERFVALLGEKVSVDPIASSHVIEPTSTTGWRHPVDGKSMALVGAGNFLGGPQSDSVWLPSFRIDVYPVTNSEYMHFVASTGHRPPDHWPQGSCPATIYDHPVTFVTWHDAQSYALWAHKELPTSQQWEKAARGDHGDTYPWGDQQTPAKCNTRESGIGSTVPVSRYHSGVSPYGIYDLCGNVWEWCRPSRDAGRYELKGGAFTSPFARCTPYLFNDAASTMLDDDTGFRCCASDPDAT
jgi:formylglycine-generating enzyme required for sulfatase activity